MITLSTRAKILSSLLAAAAIAVACGEKDEDKAKGTVSAENKEDAKKASVVTTSKVLAKANSSSSLRSPETRAKLKALYSEANRRVHGLQDDPTTAPGDFDICSYFNQSCEQTLNVEDKDADGTVCKTTSCANSKITNTCTSPQQTAACKDVTYTFSESTATSVIGCTTDATTKKSTFSISANFAGSISGGSITTPVELACTVNISMAIGTSSDDSSDDAAELSCEAGQFSCTLGGEELSCEDMKKAMDENQCG